MNFKELGEKIKQARVSKSLSQEDIAHSLNTRQTLISKIERGDFSGVSSILLLYLLQELNFTIDIKS